MDDLLDPVLVGRHPRVDAGKAVPRAADAPRGDADLAALGVAHEERPAAVALMRQSNGASQLQTFLKIVFLM